MSKNKLHIISFDIPYPPNYGGVVDVFYKIKSLHEQGVSIYLHMFEYGRKQAKELEKYCEKVFYYKRKLSPLRLVQPLPYIVITRKSKELINYLLQDDYPILFEGLHSCYYLSDKRLKNRTKIVRMHNIEHDYYQKLADIEHAFLKKTYLKLEASKLKKFEKKLIHAQHIAAISYSDTEALKKKYKNVFHLSAFHSNEQVICQEGKGKYILYHGNLAVGENNEAALFLAKKVFSAIDFPCIIAGNNPSKELIRVASLSGNIKIKANIETKEIHELIQHAQINILPTFQATGLKLKLLSALFEGRFCIVNDQMVVNTGLEKLCIIRNTPEELINGMKEFMLKKFSKEEIISRKKILEEDFSNKNQTKKIISLLYE